MDVPPHFNHYEVVFDDDFDMDDPPPSGSTTSPLPGLRHSMEVRDNEEDVEEVRDEEDNEEKDDEDENDDMEESQGAENAATSNSMGSAKKKSFV